MVHMLLAAERTRLIESHPGIQGFVAGLVGDDALIIQYAEIRTFKHLVFVRAHKYEFHSLGICHCEKVILMSGSALNPFSRLLLSDRGRNASFQTTLLPGVFPRAIADARTVNGPGTIRDVRLDMILAHGFV